MIKAGNICTPALPFSPLMPSQVDYLFKRLLSATPSELPVLRDALKTHRSTLTPKLWTVLESAKPGDASLLPSASALASYDPDDARWEAVGGKVAQALVSVNPILLGSWLDALASRAWQADRSARHDLPGQEPPRDRTHCWRPTSSLITPATIPTGLPNCSWSPSRRRI